MAASCPIPTPAERLKGDILARARGAMLDKVAAAIEAAQAEVETGWRDAGLDDSAPPRGYYAATAHQTLFCKLCGADPETFAGGNPAVALATIRNCEAIARQHWGLDGAPGRTEV